MKHFNIEEAWANELMPEGFVIPSSTVISGQGGSGKPLLGFSVISSWLKQGGNLIFILTSTGKSFAEQSLKKLYNLEMTKYKKNTQFIKFDAYIEPTVKSIENTENGTIKANLVNPQVWDKTVAMADKRLKQKSELGTLVFCSAVNLFLFSKTYGDVILERLAELLKEDRTKTYLFALSTTALREKIRMLEKAADNLMFTRAEKPMKLFLKITDMRNIKFSKKEIELPFEKDDLLMIKELAENSRVDLISAISRI